MDGSSGASFPLSSVSSPAAMGAFHAAPQIAVQVLDDSAGAIGRFGGIPDEFDTIGNNLVVVAPEIMRLEKKRDTSAGLVSDEPLLAGLGGPREDQTGPRRP